MGSRLRDVRRRHENERVHIPRLPTLLEDPIRMGCIVCAVLLTFFSADPPPLLVLFTIAVSQFNGVAMLLRVFRRGKGFFPPPGSRGRTWTVRHLGSESLTLTACTLLGGLLLLRLFGPPEPVKALGMLTIAMALMPDIRLCRVILPSERGRANRLLQTGSFLHDPVKLATILTCVVFCLLDTDSLMFVVVSMVLLQFNAMMILLEKYSSYVRWRRSERGWREPLTRDAWRLVLSLLPVLIVPLRAFAGTDAGTAAATVIVGLILVPDLIRLAVLLGRSLFMGTTQVARRARRRLWEGVCNVGRLVRGVALALPFLAADAVRAVRGWFGPEPEAEVVRWRTIPAHPHEE